MAKSGPSNDKAFASERRHAERTVTLMRRPSANPSLLRRDLRKCESALSSS